MTKISSDMMYIYKIMLPIVFIIAFIIMFNQPIDPAIKFISFWVVILFIWGYAIRTQSEVYDTGNGLLVIHKNQEIEIPNNNIKKVMLSTHNNVTTFVVVYFTKPTKLGKKIVFIGKHDAKDFKRENSSLYHFMQRFKITR